MPLIRDFVAEHEQALDCADDVLRALDRRDRRTVPHLLRQMQTLLDPHWPGRGGRLFPASLTALSGDDWNAAMTAWRDAHPGEEPISS